jgi:hypothetical protein
MMAEDVQVVELINSVNKIKKLAAMRREDIGYDSFLAVASFTTFGGREGFAAGTSIFGGGFDGFASKFGVFEPLNLRALPFEGGTI